MLYDITYMWNLKKCKKKKKNNPEIEKAPDSTATEKKPLIRGEGEGGATSRWSRKDNLLGVR